MDAGSSSNSAAAASAAVGVVENSIGTGKSATQIKSSTESMVTVRLSDAELPETCTTTSTPSPTPTLKLVDEKSEEYILADNEPMRSSSSLEALMEEMEDQNECEVDNSVDWAGLEKTEDEHPKDQSAEEGTAFLLARLEQENKRLEKDPKAMIIHPERPPSLSKLRQMMDNPDPNTLRYSMLPAPPPLTDLDFYAALVADYNRAASKLPYLLSKKIREGVPPPLRGVVWTAMSGARDCNLEGLYDQLLGETSPYEQLIGKDVGRTGLEMFSQEGGEGQRMLGRVLRAFSIYDTQIGYCQGLGFLVGPLLMHMGEREAFCVLVRLMEHYDLRSCFLPNLSGLQLRMYQFTQLMATHLPDLANHLDNLGIQPTYASQWFLSFFAVTCPLPMLFRIYDVIFAEGATETMMRVALSLMRRNQKRILAAAEFEDVMQMLLSRSLWDAFQCNADDLVQDFVGQSGIVTRDILADLERKYKDVNSDEMVKLTPAKSQTSELQAAASRFLGRLWGGATNVTLSVPSRPSSTIVMQRSPSKHSLSTLNSFDTTESGTTDATTMSRCSSINDDRRLSTRSIGSRKANKDLELHNQIEDLLVALSGLQREHATKMDELHAVRESREEERKLTKRLVELLGSGSSDEEESVDEISDLCDQISDRIEKEESEETLEASRSAATQLSRELQQVREQLSREMIKSRNLANRLAEQDADVVRLKSQLLDTRGKWQDIQKENQQLQKSLSDMRQRRGSEDCPTSPGDSKSSGGGGGGLRELRLGRSNSGSKKSPMPPPIFNKRSSSLGMQSILAQSENHAPPPEDALLLELVAAKTAEAVAKQEAEEAKAKLEALRKVLTGTATAVTNVTPGYLGGSSGFPFASAASSPTVTTPGSATSGGGGGWFGGGWGAKRTASVDSR
ncbi:rab-GTPase-TBC domain-containing protein [Tricharina praecox]|uniref:rab-GTPase-TBC domain-containing protein n=1 Tax=Tricharina praecox TaxID=43433 RepID=UPI00221FFEBD|nr:rab-GTPase-TBC domain-containing protein [Tricharina praecox]KAI5848888.1 rab-GTPase-TBC domain-containing protein [Tricharina praecox]